MAQSIGLCMIVRDEAAVIERCLASAKPLIESWTICDTGSTDATPELIAAALDGIPGELRHRPWVDFGHNRSELMRLARGSADYLLLMDADMTIERCGPLPELSADAYRLHQGGALDYALPRLVRGDLDWYFVGATHEYLGSDDERRHEPLTELLLHHHGDGGARADKFERDELLLRRELERDPDDVRATFYLAQTMRDLGRTAEAIELYDRRVELGGWDEEVFYSAYQAGLLHLGSDPDEAIERLRGAHELRPTRAEPLCEAAAACRSLERWEDAYELASRAAAIPYPDDDLFISRDVYEWRSLLEQGAASWWCGRYEEALELADRLLDLPGLPAEAERIAEGNRQWALQRLGRKAPPRRLGPRTQLAELLDVERAEIRIDVEPAWPAFNPSIAADCSGGLQMVVRTANYSVSNGRYRMLDGTDSIRTVNYLGRLDQTLALRSLRPLVDRSAGPAPLATSIRGYEDCRLVRVGDDWLALAAVRDRNPDVRAEVALLELAGVDEEGEGPAAVERVSLLAGPDGYRNEKNWMPFVRDGELHAVYSCGPTVVRRIDRVGGTSEVVSEMEPPETAAHLAGGSQGVPVEEGWLFVVHESLQLGSGRRYSHRLALLDRSGRLAGLSPPFTFTGAEVEYCCGMAPRGRDLVCSFGIEDRIAALGVVDRGAALGLLEST